MRSFAKESVRLLRRCRKPDAAEFQSVAVRVGGAMVAFGLVGFFVKLVFIPINQIVMSS